MVEFSRREAQEYLLVSLPIILVNVFEERRAQSWPHLELSNRGPGGIEYRPIPKFVKLENDFFDALDHAAIFKLTDAQGFFGAFSFPYIRPASGT